MSGVFVAELILFRHAQILWKCPVDLNLCMKQINVKAATKNGCFKLHLINWTNADIWITLTTTEAR